MREFVLLNVLPFGEKWRAKLFPEFYKKFRLLSRLAFLDRAVCAYFLKYTYSEPDTGEEEKAWKLEKEI